jgi:hypothetical protein
VAFIKNLTFRSGHNIHNNGFGIAIYDNSATNVEGVADFISEDETQIIKNNEYYQLSISDGCFPTKIKWNSIYNKNGEGNFK